MIRIIYFIFIFYFFTCSPQSHAYSIGQTGDAVSYAIPLSSASIALFLKDYQGLKQMALATGIVQGTTAGLKFAVNERRPNGDCCSSFPSRHASLAFTGAAFMQFRYGLQYSIPFYVGSFYAAYSRVKVRAHSWQDVVAGGALGIAGTYLSTTRYKGKAQTIFFIADGKYAGIFYRKLFD